MNKLLKCAVLGLVALSTACTPAIDEHAEKSIETSETKVTSISEQISESTETPSTTDRAKAVDIERLLTYPDVRLAIAKAIDKRGITEYILSNGSVPADYLVPVGLHITDSGEDFRTLSGDFNTYNVEVAKEHWDNAKRDLGFDSVTFKFLTYDSEGSSAIAGYIKDQLEATLEGLTIEIETQPFNQKSALSTEGKFDIEFEGWGAEFPDANDFLKNFAKDSVQNTGAYLSEDYIKALSSAADNLLRPQEKVRLKALLTAEKTLLSDAGVIPLYQTGYAFLQSKHITGIQTHNYGAKFTFDQAVVNLDDSEKSMVRMTDVQDILMLDSSKVNDVMSQMIIGNIFEGLTRLGEDDMPVLAGAETVEISEDGLVYTFKLRPNAVWSNGTPVTANDYVYAFYRLADARAAGKNVSYLARANIKNHAAVASGEKALSELGVTAVDDYTLRIELESPVAQFLKLMSNTVYMPMNEAYTLAQEHLYGTKAENTIYNGPYTLSNWEQGYGFALLKNATYWDKKSVKNDGVMYQLSPSVEAAVELFNNNDMDLVMLSGKDIDAYKGDASFRLKSMPVVYYLVLNINNK